MPDDQTPGLGHNNPPTETKTLVQLLQESTKDLSEKADEFVAAGKRLPETIEDGDTAEKVTTLVGQLNRWLKECEAKRKAQKKPYDDAGKTVQKHFKTISDTLDGVKKISLDLLNDFQDRQEKAAAAEAEALRQKAEAERQKAEETGSTEAAVAAADAEAQADLTEERGKATTTATGQTAGRRSTWKWEVTDLKALIEAAAKGDVPLYWLMPDATEINAAVTKDKIRSVPGLRIFEQKSTVVRG